MVIVLRIVLSFCYLICILDKVFANLYESVDGRLDWLPFR